MTKLRNLFFGAVALLTAITSANAQLNPCPDCPPCTNCPPYTNTFVPTEYDPSTLLVREIQIANGTNIIYQGPNWILDTNNLLLASGSLWLGSPNSDNWTFTLGVTNTSPLRAYTVQYATNVVGPYVDVTPVFVGTTNSSEYIATVTLTNFTSVNGGFWRAKQQEGFVAWAMAATNGFIGGTAGGCPGTYHGYINWVFHLPAWGYYPDTNVTDHLSTDFREPTNHLELVTDYGFIVCNTNTVDWTNDPALSPPLYGTRSRISVFFKTYPTNQAYPLWFRGYFQPTNDILPHLAGAGTGSSFRVQAFQDMDETQMKAMGLTTNDLMTGAPAQ